MEEKEFSAAGLRQRMRGAAIARNGTAKGAPAASAKFRSRMRVSALYMRGVVERRFESYAELDGSRKVLRALALFRAGSRSLILAYLLFFSGSGSSSLWLWFSLALALALFGSGSLWLWL